MLELFIFTLILSPFIVGSLVHDRSVRQEQELQRLLVRIIKVVRCL